MHHVPDRPLVVGMLFCIGLLTVGLRLCIFCSLHFRTLHDHYRATIRNMMHVKPFLIGKAVAIFKVSRVSPWSVVCFSSLIFILDTLECICRNICYTQKEISLGIQLIDWLRALISYWHCYISSNILSKGIC